MQYHTLFLKGGEKMKLASFFKLVKMKVNKYDKYSSNPFGSKPISITLIWIDDNTERKNL